MHYARGMRKIGNASGTGGAGGKSYHQRCAIRVTYLNNRTRGQWKAHGRYLARESAAAGHSNAVGFSSDRSGIDVARELERWQSSGDPRIWKVILSPEFGERLDLEGLTRDLVGRLAVDLGTDLEWVAVTHQNTEHPHVHLAIRGIRSDGEPLQFRREYLKHGIRQIAQDLCTRQIGYRTSHDAAEAERREIGEQRFTSLDRAILRDAHLGMRGTDSVHFIVKKSLAEIGLADSSRLHFKHFVARLAVLQRMGLRGLLGRIPGMYGETSKRSFGPCNALLTGKRRSRLTVLPFPISVCRSRFSIQRKSLRWRAGYWFTGKTSIPDATI
jgi:hypothetical protein